MRAVKRVGQVLAAMAVIVASAVPAHAQALGSSRLANGTWLVSVAEPEAAATTVAWPEIAEDGTLRVESMTSGELTLVADVADALSRTDGPAPPVIVTVGRAASAELVAAVARGVADRGVEQLPVSTAKAPAEGGLERRLGAPGSDAALSLRIPLPPAGDPRRSAVEVLAGMLPTLLARETPGLLLRWEDDAFVLECRQPPEAATLGLTRLRLALARLAASPALDRPAVERVRVRQQVRRRAELEQHPDGASRVVRRWCAAGLDGVRELLFGLDGVTADSVREAAQGWLPLHPGAAVLLLPPQALNPHFAAGPRRLVLPNNLTAVVLERPAAPLAVLTVRPVVIPGIDDAGAATVLTRLAARIRAAAEPPGWVRVEETPPRLELAAEPDSLPELCEALAAGLDAVMNDTGEVVPGDGARPRVLALLGQILGVGGEEALTAARLLRPDNLALGAVAPDSDAASEALDKFLGQLGGGTDVLHGQSVSVTPKTRVAVPGTVSDLAVVLDLPADADLPLRAVLRDLIVTRGRRLLPAFDVEVLDPLLPGRPTLVLLVQGEADLDKLENTVAERWNEWLEVPGEAELALLRRAVASRLAARASGVLGEARVCAGMAAGGDSWQPAAEIERAVLAESAEDLTPALAPWTRWKELVTAGAGPLPVESLPIPAR